MHCLPQLNPRMFKHGFYDCSDLKRKLLLFKLALIHHFQIYPCRNFPPSFQAHFLLTHSKKLATSLESIFHWKISVLKYFVCFYSSVERQNKQIKIQMRLVVMMLKLLHDQGKFKSLWKRNMLKFTAIYLYPSSQISPLLQQPWHLSTISPTPLCPAGCQSHALAHMGPWMWWLMHKWEGQILLQGVYNEQKSSLPSTQALIWIALPPHQPAWIQLKLPSLQALYETDYCKVISKLSSTCNCFVSILEKYLAQCPNKDKFLKLFTRKAVIYTVMFSVEN